MELEVRYAYLERTVSKFDQVIVELRAEVEKLKRELKELGLAAREGPGEAPGNDKPPHY